MTAMCRMNITSGDYFDAVLRSQTEEASIPFREAMLTGPAHPDVFSDAFIAVRARTHHSTPDAWRAHMEPLLSFLDECASCPELVLWFGTDAFCQVNLLTLLAFLDQKHYPGTVRTVLMEEPSWRIVREKSAVSPAGFSGLYRRTLCQGQPERVADPFLDRGIRLYFDLQDPRGALQTLVYEHPQADRDTLIRILLRESADYGLSDLQAGELIDRCRADEAGPAR